MPARRVSSLVILAAALLVCGPGSPASAEHREDSLLVTTAWLAEHDHDAGLVILHVGRPETYDAGHVPGARLISLRKLLIVTPDGIRDELPPPHELAAALAEVGVGNGSRIVIYFDDEIFLSLATRLFYTLDYMGLGDRVALLDGGLPLWRDEGRPLSTEAPNASPVDFAPELQEHVRVDAEWVAANLRDPKVVLLDARPIEQYEGRSLHDEGPRPGHIPGAVSMPFFTVAREEPAYLLKSKQELADMFREAGAEEGSVIVAYCGTGIWSSPVYFAARYLGYDSRFYDGGFQEWSADDRYPVTGPVSKDDLE